MRNFQKRLDLFESSRFGLLPLREKRRYVMDPKNGVTKRLDFRPKKNERGLDFFCPVWGNCGETLRAQALCVGVCHDVK